MPASRRKHIVNATLAIVWLLLWLFFWSIFGHTTTSTTTEKIYGVTREVAASRPPWYQQESYQLLALGVYGATVAAAVIYRRRGNADRALQVFLIAPGVAVVSAIVLLMLNTVIFPSTSSSYDSELSRRLYPALAVGVIYGMGFVIWIGIPAILGALATSALLKASEKGVPSPPPLPKSTQHSA